MFSVGRGALQPAWWLGRGLPGCLAQSIVTFLSRLFGPHAALALGRAECRGAEILVLRGHGAPSPWHSHCVIPAGTISQRGWSRPFTECLLCQTPVRHTE